MTFRRLTPSTYGTLKELLQRAMTGCPSDLNIQVWGCRLGGTVKTSFSARILCATGYASEWATAVDSTQKRQPVVIANPVDCQPMYQLFIMGQKILTIQPSLVLAKLNQ